MKKLLGIALWALLGAAFALEPVKSKTGDIGTVKKYWEVGNVRLVDSTATNAPVVTIDLGTLNGGVSQAQVDSRFESANARIDGKADTSTVIYWLGDRSAKPKNVSDELDEKPSVAQMNAAIAAGGGGVGANSPAFTGTPTAPTAAAGISTTQIATTAFVTVADNLRALIASPTFTGSPKAPTATAGTNTTQIATTAFVTAAAATKANLAAPTFTGIPLAPTATAGTNTTQIATTAFVAQAVGAVSGAPSFDVKVETASKTYAAADFATSNILTMPQNAALAFTLPASGVRAGAKFIISSNSMTGITVAGFYKDKKFGNDVAVLGQRVFIYLMGLWFEI